MFIFSSINPIYFNFTNLALFLQIMYTKSHEYKFIRHVLVKVENNFLLNNGMEMAGALMLGEDGRQLVLEVSPTHFQRVFASSKEKTPPLSTGIVANNPPSGRVTVRW